MHDKVATVPVRYLRLSPVALGKGQKTIHKKPPKPAKVGHNAHPLAKARHKARGSDGGRLPDRMQVKHGSPGAPPVLRLMDLRWSVSTLAEGSSGDSKKSGLSGVFKRW